MSKTRILVYIVVLLVVVAAVDVNDECIKTCDALTTGSLLHFREALTITDEFQRLFSFEHNEIDYDAVEESFISTVKRTVDSLMGWDVQLQTYRCSNVTNLLGASGYHRDDYNFLSGDQLPPSFTIIVYLDDTIFDYIPGSHLYKKMSFARACASCMRRKRLHVSAGDIVIMYGTTVHRGVKTCDNGKRRLVQFFVAMPSAKDVSVCMVIKWVLRSFGQVDTSLRLHDECILPVSENVSHTASICSKLRGQETS